MPIHDMAWWAPLQDDVITFLEDLCNKQLIGLLCLVNKLNEMLAPTSVDKGFKVKDIKDLGAMAIFMK
jgi:hypothetical protein